MRIEISCASSSASFAAGATSVLVRAPIVNDALDEPAETFSLTATPVSGATPVAATGTATITDNDGTPQFSINDVSVNEGAGTITFTVTLSNPGASALTVDYAAASGTAASAASTVGTPDMSVQPWCATSRQ